MAYYDEEDLLPGEEFYYATDPLEGQALRTSLVGRGMDVPPLPENWRAPAELPSGYGVTYSTQGPADLSALREGEIGNGVMAQVPINAQNIVGTYAPGRPNVPIPTQGDMGMSPDFMQGVQEAYTNLPLQQAERAVAAAIQFQGLRGYQRAIQNGEPADVAMTKYGPAMFYSRPSAYPAAVRQLTPPRMTPYQKGSLDLRRQEMEMRAARPTTATVPARLQELAAYKTALEKARTLDEGDDEEAADKAWEEVDTLGSMLNLSRWTPAQLAKKKRLEELVGIARKKLENALGDTKEEQAQAELTKALTDQADFEQELATASRKRKKKVVETDVAGEAPATRPWDVGATPQAAQPVTVTGPAAPTGERVRVRSKEGKVGTVSRENLDAALKAGYTLL